MSLFRPITIQQMDDSGDWVDYLKAHAKVNKATKDTEQYSSGATRIRSIKNFDVRFNSMIQAIDYDTQSFRIIYGGQTYNIVSYDDYQERHIDVRLVGALYGS